MNNKAIGSSWADVRKEIFTPEEIAESDLRVALMGEIINARHEKGLSQKKLEELSGVKQPVIARMEKGTSDPKLTTIMKVLESLGMTLEVVPINKKPVKRMRLKGLSGVHTLGNHQVNGK
ncbi:helix-turn-helix transcriptional regulator [Eubacteriaceae bacterium ES3]|nr:helix-turn-helix transcriptional regulator [Eubacteriaceae bacterium ES3]